MSTIERETTETVTPWQLVLAYIALTKPRIIETLLVTTVPAMIVAARGIPALWLIAATLFGGTLGAGSAQAFNSIIERDSDALMNRTSKRPMAKAVIPVRNAVIFATLLQVFSFVFTGVVVNWLTSWLILAANLFYVVVYTMYLKPRTAQNIVIGGAAGCIPVLAGWSAVTGRVSMTAWLMFAVVFLWTPPHFWALAIKFRDQYKAARIPMLPVVAGLLETTRQIVGYTFIMVGFSLALGLVAQAGWMYLASALTLGGWFGVLTVRLDLAAEIAMKDATDDSEAAMRDPNVSSIAMQVFGYSIVYISLIFTALAIDVTLFSV